MGDRNSILGDSAVNLTAMAIGLAGGLATQSLLAWHLGATGRGEYGVWLAIATITAVVFTVGSDRAVQIQLISKRLSIAQAVSTTITITLVGSAVAVSALFLASHYQWSWIQDLAPADFVIALLVVPAVALTTTVHLLLAGLRHFRAAAIFGLVRIASQLVLVVLLVAWQGWSIKGAFLGLVAAAFVSNVGSLLYLYKTHGTLIARVPLEGYKRVFSFALSYLPARLGNVLNANLIVLVLALAATKTEVGLFSLAIVLMGQFLLVSEALNQAILPRFGKEHAKNISLVAQCCRISATGYLLILVPGTLILSAAVPLLFSAQFQSIVPLLWILLPGVWLRGSTGAIRSYFTATNQPSIVSRSIAIEVSVTGVSLWALYHFAGLKGAAVAASLGFASGTVILALAFRTVTQIEFAENWLWRATDSRLIKDRVVAILGISLQRRTFWDTVSANQCDLAQIKRQVIITTDSIIKKQAKNPFELELSRTQIAESVAQQSQTFCVPNIIQVQPDQGAIHFERIVESQSLWAIFCQDSTSSADKLLIQAGQALAEIHHSLQYPNKNRVGLPNEWRPLAGMREVGIHGDFTAQNILVTTNTDRLVIIDWATSDLCGYSYTTGPWAFDVAWFIVSLLHQPSWFAPSLKYREQRARIFADSYCCAAGRAANTNDLAVYLRAVASKVSRPSNQGFSLRHILHNQRPSHSHVIDIANSMSKSLSGAIAA